MGRQRIRHRHLVIVLLFASGLSVGGAQDGNHKSIESTRAYQLLLLERNVGSVPPDAETLLRSVLTDATKAAVTAHRQPTTTGQALAVLEAIQISLAKHNFLQPPEQKDWPQTLGAAFRPLTKTPDEMKRILAHPDNKRRIEYLDPTKPFYFVDCDMGSQLFLAVAERLDWDIRLVEVPNHNFVRWHLLGGGTVNWDWIHGESRGDDQYASAATEDVRLKALYLRSFRPEEANAYFLGLIASKAARPSDAERLFRQALEIEPPNPVTLNNLAWLYATTAQFAAEPTKVDIAVRYGLAAWSLKPDDGNVADTAACALAVSGQRALAERVEEYATGHATSQSQLDSFRANLARIRAGESCQ